MNISEKYFDFTAGAKEVSDLDLLYIVSPKVLNSFPSNAYHGHKVGAVRSVTSESAAS